MSDPALRSVLIADDEAGIRLLVSRKLEEAGYEVRTAADGEHVVKALEERPADVLLIDIIMPNREGIETIIEVKRRWPGVYVVAMSGGGRVPSGEFLHLAANLGADLTLAKPFTSQQLLAAVKSGDR